MSNEMKSKFRDRASYYKKLFFLRKKKGFDINNLDKDDNENKSTVKKELSDNIDKVIKNDGYTSNHKKKNVKRVVVKKGDNPQKIVKVKKGVRIKYRRKKKIGIGDQPYQHLLDKDIPLNNEFGYYDYINGVKNFNKFKNIKDINDIINNKDLFNKYLSDYINYNLLNHNFLINEDINFNNFDLIEHIKKKDKELLLNEIIYSLENKCDSILFNLDNLYSEYYNISLYSDDEIIKEDCERKLNEIIKIKKEIEKLDEQFNIITSSKYLDNILELDDSNLVDKIINYKLLCTSIKDKKELYNNYKKIDVYDKLNEYFSIFSKKIDDLNQEKEKKIEELELRDKDFDLFKKNVDSVNIKNEQYFLIINRQVDICNKILNDVDKIYKSEEVYNKINGLGNFISSSVRYLFYLSVSPFRRLIPSIAMNTLAARDMVNIARNSLSSETIRKVNYYAKDHEYELNKYLYDVNDLSNLLHSTMDDIQSFKREFDKKFGKYKNDIYEYGDVLSKIDKIEKMLNFNMEKVNKIKKDIVKGKEKNKNKLIKIKRLNDN